MTDKGFKTDELLGKIGVTLNSPPFSHRDCFTADEIAETEEIANLRIHVERRIQRMRALHIFDRPVPLTITPIVNEIWGICAFLTNLQNPLIASR